MPSLHAKATRGRVGVGRMGLGTLANTGPRVCRWAWAHTKGMQGPARTAGGLPGRVRTCRQHLACLPIMHVVWCFLQSLSPWFAVQVTAEMKRAARQQREAARQEKAAARRRDKEEIFEVRRGAVRRRVHADVRCKRTRQMVGDWRLCHAVGLVG